MPKEIERKFLLKEGARVPQGLELDQIQGYLPTKKGVTARVRIEQYMGVKTYFLTFKGPTKGISRMEIETEVPPELARSLMKLCDRTVSKRRRVIKYKGHQWEVDFFHKRNKGLVVVEVELGSPREKVELPPWIGKEVTGIKKYSCSNLAKRPYRSW